MCRCTRASILSSIYFHFDKWLEIQLMTQNTHEKSVQKFYFCLFVADDAKFLANHRRIATIALVIPSPHSLMSRSLRPTVIVVVVATGAASAASIIPLRCSKHVCSLLLYITFAQQLTNQWQIRRKKKQIYKTTTTATNHFINKLFMCFCSDRDDSVGHIYID